MYFEVRSNLRQWNFEIFVLLPHILKAYFAWVENMDFILLCYLLSQGGKTKPKNKHHP